MKNILLIICFACICSNAFSQKPTLKTSPSDVDALTENVALIFDVTGTALEGINDLYIWSWSNDIKSGPTEMLLCYNGQSGDWGNVSEIAKLTHVAGNLFKIQLPLTVTRDKGIVTFSTISDLFGFTENPGGLKAFGFLLRTKSGSSQASGDDFKLVPLAFEESLFRTFPSSVSNSDIVSLYYNMNLSTNPKMLISKEIGVSISFLDSDGHVVIRKNNIPTTIARKNEYSISFLTEKLAVLPSNKSINDIVKMKANFYGIIETNGVRDTVKSEVFSKDFAVFE
jgi:hypothetical protein